MRYEQLLKQYKEKHEARTRTPTINDRVSCYHLSFFVHSFMRTFHCSAVCRPNPAKLANDSPPLTQFGTAVCLRL